MEPLTFEDGTKVPSRGRMNSAPVYSTDAMQEMIKGTSLVTPLTHKKKTH